MPGPVPDPGVVYDWPEGGGDPFDTSPDETRWVLLAGRRLGRTWPAGDLRDFGSWSTDFESRVPMGYKVIQVAERLAVVDHGRVVREWPESGLAAPTADAVLDQWPLRGMPTFSVVDGGGPRRAPDGTWVTHEHEWYDDALAEAVGMRDRRALVVRLLTERNWH